METNTLVRHRKYPKLGIGCVSKIFKVSVAVNFGLDDVKRCKEADLEVIDTSGCETVTAREYISRIVSRIVEDKSEVDCVILGNELRHYVGIGWITIRVITEEDLKKYKRVI